MLPTVLVFYLKYYIGINVGNVGRVLFWPFWGRFRPETTNHATQPLPGPPCVATVSRFGASDFSENEGPLQEIAVSSKKPAGG